MSEIVDNPLPRPMSARELARCLVEDLRKYEGRVARRKRREPNPNDVEMVRLLRAALMEG